MCSKIALSSLTSFVHWNDPYVLNGSYVNYISQVVISYNKASLVYDIWELVDMIQNFLSPCDKVVYKYKLVKSTLVDFYTFIHPGNILFAPRSRVNMDHLEEL